jgi:tyrosine-protein kinase Etk/Wzc
VSSWRCTEIGGSMTEDEINLAVYWKALVKRRRLVAYIVGSAFVMSCIVSLILPKEYEATASILPSQQDNMLDLGSKAENMGLPTSLLSGMMDYPNDVWVGILKSQTITDAIIARFNLRALYKTKNIEGVRKQLLNKVDISKDKKDNILTITVVDKDPERAAEMANAFVEELDKVNKDVTMTSGKRTRIFMEQRLKGAKADLDAAERAIEEFQRKNRAVDPDTQAKVIIESFGEVKGRLMAKQVELQTLLSYAQPTNPQVEILRTEVRELEQRLRELENKKSSRYGAKNSQDIFVPTGMMPALAMEYTRLMREKAVQESLYKVLVQQYEMAKIQEVKDSPTLQVLDYAKVPETKVKPNRKLIVASSTFFGFFVSCLWVFILERKGV